MKEDNVVLGLVVISSVFGLFLLGLWVGSSLDLHSKERINPDLKIKIENGVSDTTYIYKNK